MLRVWLIAIGLECVYMSMQTKEATGKKHHGLTKVHKKRVCMSQSRLLMDPSPILPHLGLLDAEEHEESSLTASIMISR